MTISNKFENMKKVKNLAFPKFFTKGGYEAEILVTLWRKWAKKGLRQRDIYVNFN